MTALNFLYIALGIGFLAFVAIIGVVANQVIKTLISLRILIERTDDIVHDVKTAKDTLKIGVIGKAAHLLKLVF